MLDQGDDVTGRGFVVILGEVGAAVTVSPEVGERDAVACGDEGGGEVAPGGAQVAHAGDAHDERAGARYLVGDGAAIDGDHIH